MFRGLLTHFQWLKVTVFIGCTSDDSSNDSRTTKTAKVSDICRYFLGAKPLFCNLLATSHKVLRTVIPFYPGEQGGLEK